MAQGAEALATVTRPLLAGCLNLSGPVCRAPVQLLWDLSRDVAFRRAEFMATQVCNSAGASSVLVTDVPGLQWGTPLNRVGGSDLRVVGWLRCRVMRWFRWCGSCGVKHTLATPCNYLSARKQPIQGDESAVLLACVLCLQLQLTWVKWLLPAGLFRRGFDQQRQQQQQGAGSTLQTPLLQSQAGRQAEGVMQDVWDEAVDTLQHNGGDVQVRSHHAQPQGSNPPPCIPLLQASRSTLCISPHGRQQPRRCMSIHQLELGTGCQPPVLTPAPARRLTLLHLWPRPACCVPRPPAPPAAASGAGAG